MQLRHVFKSCLVAVTMVLAANFGSESGSANDLDQSQTNDEGQVQTRGPVHEAFAETVTYDPQPGLVVPKSPPDSIVELVPDQKPEGKQISWIPGYWAWDEDRDDFLWVSGIWRALPPGRQWVPGYWGKSGSGAQWTSGYWADAKQTENEYLPEPPASAEKGPQGNAPSANDIWISGTWARDDNRYTWQPGYWAPAQQDWVWVPSHYQWSPRGYVFNGGYYDYAIARRGVMFAPVYFQSSVYGQNGFTYSPVMAINLAVFRNQLFLRPNYGHYYFGDYYGSSYSGAGYYPSFSFNSGGIGYDPFYAQQLWQNRQDPGWTKSVKADFQYRVDHADARPPRTMSDQQTLAKNGTKSSQKNVVVAMPLDELAKSKANSLKLQPVTKEEQQTIAKQALAVNQFGKEREKMEAKGVDTSDNKSQLAKSPIVAKSSEESGKDHTPPNPHQAPASDPKVEPKPRETAAKGHAPKSEPVTVKAAKPVLQDDQPKSTSGKPKDDPKPESKAEGKPESPKSDSKPEAKAEPKPASPKPAPKTESKPEPPKVESKQKP